MAEEIAPGIWRLESDYPLVCSFPLWLYLVDGGDGSYALLDTGVPTTLDRVLRDELKACGVVPADLTILFNSHGHPDHMGGNAALLAETEAQVAAPLGEAVWIEDHARHWRELWDGFPGALTYNADMRTSVLADFCGEDTRVDRVLRDGDVLTVGRRELQVILTKGHSPDHLALYDPESKVLFSFDDVQASGTAYLEGDVELAPLYWEPDEYRTGLHRLSELPFETLAGSHNPPASREAGLTQIEESIRWTHSVDDLLDRMIQTDVTVTTAGLAEAIGTELGPYGGVTLQTTSVADGHLRSAARLGRLKAAWTRS
jgi:glyoxylase-like metal-dependent hydrolase (beta-lactamase superfamily II)